MTKYRCYGLVLASELELPDLGAPLTEDVDADVVIRLGSLAGPPAGADPLPYGLWRQGPAAGVEVPKMGVLPSGLLRAVALVHGGTRELAEMSYQFESPFVLDSSRSEALLGLAPTPMEVALKSTVDWWRTQAGS